MRALRIPPAPYVWFLLAIGFPAAGAAPADPALQLRVEEVHPWRPPFGVDRVGQSRVVVVEATDALAAGELTLAARLAGREVARQAVTLPNDPPHVARAWFEGLLDFDEVTLIHTPPGSAVSVELARQKLSLPPFEADALARPEQLINPVDLNAILVPGDWLLLGPEQSGRLTVRAIQRREDKKQVAVKAWFESREDEPATAQLTLRRGERAEATLVLPQAAAERDVIHVTIVDAGGDEIWQKHIITMRVPERPKLPRFGAVETRLRYDAPISVRDPATGDFSSLPYANAWDPQLKDVVVALPNGSRFVFWRGSSYIPFWATRHNVGLCCEWAEMIPPFPPDRTDCIEPLMDKELRYGRVEVVESTAARVHVRWTYQSTDLLYKVWGDQAVEDYFFYPDGFGTRVLTLKRDPVRNYELSEVILIAPQETYPLSFVPRQPIDILFPDGETRRVSFPATVASLGAPRDTPAVYRLRAHKDDPASVVYFTPRQRTLPPAVFGAFYDRGQLVTPAYWGSHWPLARGNATGNAIDERIHATPHHTSLMTWVGEKPEPVSTRVGPSIDALGRSKVMTTEQWVWMIGMTDAPDGDVLAQAQSFADPPSLETLTGARLESESFAPDRRAIRLIAEAPSITLTVRPAGVCVNPVFEIRNASPRLSRVILDDSPLPAESYAWDGKTLWLNATLHKPATLQLDFGD